MAMSHLLSLEIPIWEKILRSAVIYFFILIAFRFAGKRQVGQLTPFDLVVLLIISNVVQNALIGEDNSLTGGIIGAVTILLLNYFVSTIAYRSKRVRRLLEASPTLLIHDGKVLHKSLEKEHMSFDDLLMGLRQQGLTEPSQARFAVLEETGHISVIPYKD